MTPGQTESQVPIAGHLVEKDLARQSDDCCMASHCNCLCLRVQHTLQSRPAETRLPLASKVMIAAKLHFCLGYLVFGKDRLLNHAAHMVCSMLVLCLKAWIVHRYQSEIHILHESIESA